MIISKFNNKIGVQDKNYCHKCYKAIRCKQHIFYSSSNLTIKSYTAVQTAADAEKWIALMKQYVNPVELTAELLNTLIEKITAEYPNVHLLQFQRMGYEVRATVVHLKNIAAHKKFPFHSLKS